ncbi:MAG: hypothetical protein HYW26_00920 [Candidatus Aenigmarchaeota archaeon]|nr:hypothetical protein [Candidatus Aenigmarchaeota archaeon]
MRGSISDYRGGTSVQELVDELTLMMPGFRLRGMLRGLLMPSLDTSGLPYDVRSSVERSFRKINQEDDLGVGDKPENSRVPVVVYENGPPGVTGFQYDPIRDAVKVPVMGFNRRLPSHLRPQRVTDHETRHVRSRRLLKSADVPQPLATLFMETYAEYGGWLNEDGNGRREIETTTPYREALAFGDLVNRYYVSPHDGKEGFKPFIRDTVRYRSMSRTLEALELRLPREEIPKLEKIYMTALFKYGGH